MARILIGIMTHQYFKMTEVVKRTKVSKSTLVRWESQGAIPRPKRQARTRARLYTEEDVQKIIEFRDKIEEPPEPSRSTKKGK